MADSPRRTAIRFDPSLEQLRIRYHKIADRVVDLVHNGIAKNAELMAAELRETTPRSETGPHVADGWTTRKIDEGPGVLTLEVYNQDPRADQPLKLVDGTVLPYSLMIVLEYGSAPHIIRAKFAKTLRFYWPVVGRVVYPFSVEHPGTRPYGMVALATSKAVDRALRLLDAAREVITSLGGRYS